MVRILLPVLLPVVLLLLLVLQALYILRVVLRECPLPLRLLLLPRLLGLLRVRLLGVIVRLSMVLTVLRLLWLSSLRVRVLREFLAERMRSVVRLMIRLTVLGTARLMRAMLLVLRICLCTLLRIRGLLPRLMLVVLVLKWGILCREFLRCLRIIRVRRLRSRLSL